MKLCPVCKKPSRGFGLSWSNLHAPELWFCSMKHQGAWRSKAKKGVRYHMDWRPDEDKLMLEAGKVMGQYLDSIGRTITPGLTPDEWLQALRCYTQAYCEGRGTSFDELNDEIPF